MHNLLAGEGAADGAIEPPQLLARAAAGASAIGPQHLINSKLKPPLRAAACIERRALLTRLDSVFRRKLVLLAVAGACCVVGAGYTTWVLQLWKSVM